MIVKKSGIITLIAAAALISCTDLTILEPCPELSEAEMKETILGEWELTAIGHNTEATLHEAQHVVHEDTLASSISHIEYQDCEKGYSIAFVFKNPVSIEHMAFNGEHKDSSSTEVERYEMTSASLSSFPLNFKYNDDGLEVFKTATYRNENGEMTEYSFNYQVGFYGRDIISKFEIDWFIIESDHLFYEFTRR